MVHGTGNVACSRVFLVGFEAVDLPLFAVFDSVEDSYDAGLRETGVWDVHVENSCLNCDASNVGLYVGGSQESRFGVDFLKENGPSAVPRASEL